MCTEAQLNKITRAMVDCYRVVYGDDMVKILDTFANSGESRLKIN